MEISEQISRHWVNQRLVIGRVGKSALECPSAFEKSVPAEKFRPKDKYEALAIDRVSAFQTMDREKVSQLLTKGSSDLSQTEVRGRRETWDEISGSSSVVYGFLVTARILSYAALAYRQHAESVQSKPSVYELGSILRRSKSFDSTAGRLALMKQRPDNQAWEQAAHLTDGLYLPWPGYTPLAVEQDKQGKYLTFSNMTLVNAVCEIADSDKHAPATAGKCPAAEVFLPRLWQQMITDCMADPHLFQADLATSDEAMAR